MYKIIKYDSARKILIGSRKGRTRTFKVPKKLPNDPLRLRYMKAMIRQVWANIYIGAEKAGLTQYTHKLYKKA